MGDIVSAESIDANNTMLSRLLIYAERLQQIKKTESVSKPISEALLKCRPNRRSMKLGAIFNEVIDKYPDGVIIKDIDVMFNPNYEVDVLRILGEARKRKNFSVVWPGKREGSRLIYSEEGYEDYKVFEIANYDITCVI